MKLDAIGIPCKDIENSQKFYQSLGFTFESFGEGHLEAVSKTGVRIMLDSYELMKKINPTWKEPNGPSISLCFLQETPNRVDEIYSELLNKGGNPIKEPWDAFWGQRYASIKDPNGHQIDLFSPLEKE